MQTRLNPYLSFKDNAREAMEFYQSVFGGKLDVKTFKELQSATDASDENLVMHSELVTDNGLTIMASDTPAHMEFKPGTNCSISLSGENDEELTGYYQKLTDGAAITMPLSASPWGDKFGMLTDKYGVAWLVNITQPAVESAQA